MSPFLHFGKSDGTSMLLGFYSNGTKLSQLDLLCVSSNGWYLVLYLWFSSYLFKIIGDNSQYNRVTYVYI